MERKIFIHIGMQKTGSTWFQKIILPQISSLDTIYKESFRDAMYKWRDRDLLITYENYVGYPHIVESRDLNGFMETRYAALKNLSTLFPDASIILVVRNQVSFVRSIYNQYIKVGGSLSFEEYMWGSSEYALEKDALMYMQLIEDIKKHFNGKLLLMDFELFKEDKCIFGKTLMDFIGASEDIDFEEYSNKRVNESLSNRQLRTMRKVNSVASTEHSPYGIKLNRKVYKLLRTLVLKTSKYAAFISDKGTISTENKKRIEKLYMEDWKAVSRLMVNGQAII